LPQVRNAPVSQPTPYSPAHSFISDSATLSNFPGQSLDIEFNDVKTTTDQILANLALIQRDDGAPANGIVTYDTLSPALQSNGLATAAAWLSATNYSVGTTVYQSTNLYRCLIAHTAGVFATDLAAGNWLLLVALPPGPTGPANTLAIGTVGAGTAAATITGAAPNQTLNLVLPPGATGPTGPTGATGPISSFGGQTGAITLNAADLAMSSSTLQLSAARKTTPTIQRFTSGTAATYTTPAGCLWIRVRMVGGGSGGGGGGTGGGISGAGTASTWSGGTLSAGGAAATTQNTSGGTGGAATGGNVANVNGATGWGATNLANTNSVGGANSFFGGGGAGTIATTGGSAVTNSGSGGASGPATVASAGGSGGGAGGYVEHIIGAPAATYTYTVGTGGAGGAAGTSGAAGGAGAAGVIIVEEYYGS
jgi:hypothetical protein